MYDVVFISCGKHDIHSITQNAINSLISSEDNIRFNIIVVESEKSLDYKNCSVIYPSGPFNYNDYINQAAAHCKGEFLTFCNNDLIFHSGWFLSHLLAFEQHPTVQSLSPKCPRCRGAGYKNHENFKSGVYFGFRIGYEVAGWCITIRRHIFDIMGGLDTSTFFWYSDNNYAMQLKKSGYLHGLNADSLVTHLFGKSHCLLNDTEHATTGQKKFFINNWTKTIKYL